MSTLPVTALLRQALLFLFFGSALLLPTPMVADEEAIWYTQVAGGDPRVHLYFFWSRHCPHCQEARPFVDALPHRLPWLVLHSLEVSGSQANAQRYLDMATRLGQEASSVPAFMFCGKMLVGYGAAETTGRALERHLQDCYQGRGAGGNPSAFHPLSAGVPGAATTTDNLIAEPPELPLLGRLDPERLSLPVYTLVIAGLDAFNPCAFFVLLFLLSLLVHAHSRARMLFIGGVFVLFSGLIYFLFMAAWLNLFLWMGELRLVTLGAGALAVLVALVNIKDYFWFKQGLSLTIPDSAKPGFYARVRGLLRADSLPALTLGTVALSIVANAYELLCTAGFPMIYTRILTLADVPPAAHYLYLGLYNLIYVIPLLAIVLVFTQTLGRRKLSEAEGRLLKLVSGLMMLGLGSLLLIEPGALNNPLAALGLLSAALGLAWLIHRNGPRLDRAPPPT
jgi:hypothetical protein